MHHEYSVSRNVLLVRSVLVVVSESFKQPSTRQDTSISRVFSYNLGFCNVHTKYSCNCLCCIKSNFCLLYVATVSVVFEYNFTCLFFVVNKTKL